MTSISMPRPRPAVADPDLTRPDWVGGQLRDPDKLWLDKNENTDPDLAAVVRDVVAALPTETFFTYPESGPLYRKLAGHAGVGADRLILANGSDGAIRAVFEAFVSPGDIVIHSRPTFAMYGVYCRMYGADARAVDYRPSNAGPALTADDMIDAIAAAGTPRLVCLPNPDSPTGTTLSTDDMRRVIEAAGAAGAVMLVDEAYYPFHPDTVLPLVDDYPHLVVTRSTGKAWGLAGFRIGYAAAAPDLAKVLHKVRPMYECSTMAVVVFEAMLDHWDAVEASVKRLEDGKAFFLDSMESLGFRALRGAGNFLHVAFGERAEAVHAALEDRVYYRKDFNDPCLKGFTRFSCTTRDGFAPLVEAIREAIGA